MTPEQIAALVLGSTVVGGVVTKLIDWLRDWRAGSLERRRAEVDRAVKREQDRKLELLAARADNVWLREWVRLLEESLLLHRRRMFEAPCIDPDALPPYPTKPSKELTPP